MGRLVLEGATLGNKHEHYNKLAREAVTNKEQPAPEKLSVDDNDVDNLLKIDIASHNRNVEYILEALKNEDMLYVSRAIKQSTWLITDAQYADIVNPQYLHTKLFPQMTSTANNKLLLHIRLNLKNETRADQFYCYYKEKNVPTAIKWLPYCSLDLVLKEIETLKENIPIPIFKRLCEKSITVLEKYIPKCDYYKREVLKAAMFLINFHPEKYLDVIDTLSAYEIPNFTAKATATLMKKCPQRIIDNFEKYNNRVHLETFAKHLQSHDIKSFLLKYVGKESMKNWFRFENLKPFIRYLPREGKFEFLKKVFIDKEFTSTCNKSSYYENSLYCALDRCGMANDGNTSSSANIYSWYRFAPFEVAFPDIKKLIRSESSPNERMGMLTVLLICARRNPRNIHTVLQFYNDKHINEPFKFKIQFVNALISHATTHSFDDKTWNLLNSLFCSMEVYAESENNVQFCIQSIIVYKILHYEKVPEIIEKKFVFSTLKSIRNKLNKEEEEKVFAYLYNLLFVKIKNKNLEVESELSEAVKLLEEVLNLIIDWNKEFLDFPRVLTKIKSVIDTKTKKSFKTDLSPLYNKNKSWRKHLFDESLIICPSEKTCMNALKHNPSLLELYKDNVVAMQYNDKILLDRLFRKMRIYWPESLASEWAALYTNKLDQQTGYKTFIRGLCLLLPQSELNQILNKYKPNDTKIRWSEDDELMLNIRKQLAKNMYLSRPLIPLDIILSYSSGDYLQYGLGSLNAVLHEMSSVNCRLQYSKFMEAPVSLQKHGIRLAFTKLTPEEIKKIFSDVWKSTKNSTIRAVLFKQTFNILCKETNPSVIADLWHLMNTFIENLSTDENKIIYTTLGKMDKVPLNVRGKFCMKGYTYLKSLPAKANVDSILFDLTREMSKIIELLDADFLENILLDGLEEAFTTKRYYELEELMTTYLLRTKDASSQNERYEKVLRPLLAKCIAKWNHKVDGTYHARQNVECLLANLCKDISIYGIENDMVFPIKMFTDILAQLSKGIPIENNYVLLRRLELATAYITLLEGRKKIISSVVANFTEEQRTRRERSYEFDNDKTWNDLRLTIAPDFTAICADILKQDVKTYSMLVHRLFAKALTYTLNYMQFNSENTLDTLKVMFEYKDFIELKLVALKVLPTYNYSDTAKDKWIALRKQFCAHPSREIQMHYHVKFDAYRDDFE